MAILDSSSLGSLVQHIKAYVTNQINVTLNTSTISKATSDAQGNVISDTYATKTYANTAINTAVNNLSSSSNFLKSASVDGNTLTITKGNNSTVTFTPDLSWSNVTNKPSVFTPDSHNQASNTIDSLTGYIKPNSTSVITESDTLNEAIGKLEKALDGKQAAGDYLPLSGGTLTGNILFSGINNRVVGFQLTNNGSNLDIGWNWDNGDGAGFALRSTDSSAGTPGSFDIFARNSTSGQKSLVGKPDGTLTWGGSNIITAAGGTITGTLVLSKTTDASGTANNSPALIVGGAATGAHIEIDANEILCKSNGTTLTTLYLQDGNACTYLNTSAFGPNVTNKITCGASGKVWKQLFAATTTISTSDERSKQQIDNIPDEVLDAWEEIGFKQFKFNDAVEEKGENARFHNGVIAQRIKSVFEKHNLDPYKYGFFCYDEWDVHEDPKDDTSPVIRKENGYAIRYEEALVIEAAYQRRKNKQLEDRIKVLEEQVQQLLNNNSVN